MFKGEGTTGFPKAGSYLPINKEQNPRGIQSSAALV
jgi:hypothetical protein